MAVLSLEHALGNVQWRVQDYRLEVLAPHPLSVDLREHTIAGLADSKTLTAARREAHFDEIRAKALCCSIAEASVEEIDALNILQATMLAMRRAVQGLRLKPTLALVDGNRLPLLGVPAEAIPDARGEALQWALLRGSRSGRVAWQVAPV